MAQSYNNPLGGTPSSVGNQFRTDYYQKRALIDARKTQFFGQLADTVSMPKNMGKTIKRFHYLPLLDDANINDQGLDAVGATTTRDVTIKVTQVDGANNTVIPNIPGNGRSTDGAYYFVGTGANAAAAEDAVIAKVNAWAESAVLGGGLALAFVGTADAKFATYVNPTNGTAYAKGFRFSQPNGTVIAVGAGALEAQSVPDYSNLYGSSKDVGVITSKLPALAEAGGLVNRVGFKRVSIEGSISKFGIYDEYTQESIDFDTDAELEMHITREMVNGANEVTEDALQIDLLNGAGVVRYTGAATQASEITGEGVNKSVITYDDLIRLSVDLDDNRTPKDTQLITGTLMVDTKTINAARYMYVGSELVPLLKRMADSFGNQAFVSVEKYGHATTVAIGEIGTIDQFRIIVVPEMMHWAGAGATVTTNVGYRESGGKYNVYPMLVIGSNSFATIGFQTDGKTVKFKIKHSSPGSPESFANDRYGEKGFMSIKWYYGTMILRPEWIALVKTVATW